MKLLRLLFAITTNSRVESWSLFSSKCIRKKFNLPCIRGESTATASFKRRQLLRNSAYLSLTASIVPPNTVNAACLQGDLRPTCIGIYKIPDEEIYPFFTTREEFQTLWPDLKYVPRIEPPKSFESAMELLQAQRSSAESIQRQILEGNLERAGISVLKLIPLVANGCNRILRDLAQTRIRVVGGMVKGGDSETLPPVFQTLVNKIIIVNSYWSECDMVIGQGLRGELGGMQVAQLAILASLKKAIMALDDFIAMADLLSRKF